MLKCGQATFAFVFLGISSLLPEGGRIPPFQFDLSVSCEGGSRPTIHSVFSYLEDLGTDAVLTPSKVGTSPLDGTSTGTKSFGTILCRYTLVILVDDLPSNGTSDSLLYPEDRVIFGFGVCGEGSGFPRDALHCHLSRKGMF